MPGSLPRTPTRAGTSGTPRRALVRWWQLWSQQRQQTVTAGTFSRGQWRQSRLGEEQIRRRRPRTALACRLWQQSSPPPRSSVSITAGGGRRPGSVPTPSNASLRETQRLGGISGRSSRPLQPPWLTCSLQRLHHRSTVFDRHWFCLFIHPTPVCSSTYWPKYCGS